MTPWSYDNSLNTNDRSRAWPLASVIVIWASALVAATLMTAGGDGPQQLACLSPALPLADLCETKILRVTNNANNPIGGAALNQRFQRPRSGEEAKDREGVETGGKVENSTATVTAATDLRRQDIELEEILETFITNKKLNEYNYLFSL